MIYDEDEFRPNPHFDALSMAEHRALARELNAIHRRLTDLADELVARYRYPTPVFNLAADAADAVGWLELVLDNQSILDDPEHADHPYLPGWPVELFRPVSPPTRT